MANPTLPFPCTVTVFKDSGKPGVSVDLHTERSWFTFGNHEDCDVRIHAPGIATLHAMIEVKPDKVLLHGLDYIYPVFIPRCKKSIRRQEFIPLLNDDVFMLGKRKFRVSYDSPIHTILNTGDSESSTTVDTASPTSPESVSEDTRPAVNSPQQQVPVQSKAARKRRTSLVITASDETFVSNMTDPSRLLQRLPLATNPSDKASNSNKSTTNAHSRRVADTSEPELAAPSTPTKTSSSALETPQPGARKTPSASRATPARANRSWSRDVESPRAQKRLPFAPDDEEKKKGAVLKPPSGRTPAISTGRSRSTTPARMVTRSATKATLSLPPPSFDISASQLEMECLSASARRELVYSRLCRGLPATPLRGDGPSKAKARLPVLVEASKLQPEKSSGSHESSVPFQGLDDDVVKTNSAKEDLPPVQRDENTAPTEHNCDDDRSDTDVAQLSGSIKDISLCPESSLNSIPSEELGDDVQGLANAVSEETIMEKDVDEENVEDGDETSAQDNEKSAGLDQVIDYPKETPSKDCVVPNAEITGGHFDSSRGLSLHGTQNSVCQAGVTVCLDEGSVGDVVPADNGSPKDQSDEPLESHQMNTSRMEPSTTKAQSHEFVQTKTDGNVVEIQPDIAISDPFDNVSRDGMESSPDKLPGNDPVSISEPSNGSKGDDQESVITAVVNPGPKSSFENEREAIDPNNISSVNLLVAKFEDKKKLSRVLRPLALPVQKAFHSGVDSSSLPKVSIQVTELESQMKKVCLFEQPGRINNHRAVGVISQPHETETEDLNCGTYGEKTEKVVAMLIEPEASQEHSESSPKLAAVNVDGNVLEEVISERSSRLTDGASDAEAAIPKVQDPEDDSDRPCANQDSIGVSFGESSPEHPTQEVIPSDAVEETEGSLTEKPSGSVSSGNDASDIAGTADDQRVLAIDLGGENVASGLPNASEIVTDGDEKGESDMPLETGLDNDAGVTDISCESNGPLSATSTTTTNSANNACPSTSQETGFYQSAGRDISNATSELDNGNDPDSSETRYPRSIGVEFPGEENGEKAENLCGIVSPVQNESDPENSVSAECMEIEDVNLASGEGPDNRGVETSDQADLTSRTESVIEMEGTMDNDSENVCVPAEISLEAPIDTAESEPEDTSKSDQKLSNMLPDDLDSKSSGHTDIRHDSSLSDTSSSPNHGSESAGLVGSQDFENDSKTFPVQPVSPRNIGAVVSDRIDNEEGNLCGQGDPEGIMRTNSETEGCCDQNAAQNDNILTDIQEGNNTHGQGSEATSADGHSDGDDSGEECNVSLGNVASGFSEDGPQVDIVDHVQSPSSTGDRSGSETSSLEKSLHNGTSAPDQGFDESNTTGSNLVEPSGSEKPNDESHGGKEKTESDFYGSDKYSNSEPDALQPCDIDVPPIGANDDLADDGTRTEEIEIDDEETKGSPSEARDLGNSANQDAMDDHESSEEHAEQSHGYDLDPQNSSSALEDAHMELQLAATMPIEDSENHQPESFPLNYEQEENSDEALLEAHESERSLNIQVDQELKEVPRESNDDVLDNGKNNSVLPNVTSEPELNSDLVSVAGSNKNADMDMDSDLPAGVVESNQGLEDSSDKNEKSSERIDVELDGDADEETDTEIGVEVEEKLSGSTSRANGGVHEEIVEDTDSESQGEFDGGASGGADVEVSDGDGGEAEKETENESLGKSESEVESNTPFSKESCHSDDGQGNPAASTIRCERPDAINQELFGEKNWVGDNEVSDDSHEDVMAAATDLTLCTVIELRAMLKKVHLPVSGPKADLIARLLVHRGANAAEADEAVNALPTPKLRTPRRVELSNAPDSTKVSTRRSTRVSRRLQLEDQSEPSESEKSEEDANSDISDEGVGTNDDVDQIDASDSEMNDVQQLSPASPELVSPDDSNSEKMNDEVESGEDLENNFKVYNRKTVKELKEILMDMGIEIRSKARKAELIRTILDNLPHDTEEDLNADEVESNETIPSAPNTGAVSRGSTVKELRETLKNMGLCYAGSKDVLQKRVDDALGENTRRTRRSVAADNTICSSCRAGDDCEASSM